MIYKTPSQRSNYVHVVFELPESTWADQIYLVGDFNDWNPSATPFQQDRQGKWQASLDLPAKTSHQFHYLIDGAKHTDFHADGWSGNDPASQQSVVLTNL